MSSPTAFDLIHDHLEASWSETDLVFENEPYDLPDTPTHFVYVEVVGDAYEQDTIGAPGNNMWLEAGAIYLHVMTPDGIGSREARQIGNRLTVPVPRSSRSAAFTSGACRLAPASPERLSGTTTR